MLALGSVFSLTLKKISWKSWLSQSYISPFFSIISFQSGNADSSVKTATHPKKIKKIRFSTPVILRGAARRSRRIHRLQVGKVLDSATSGIYAIRAE